MRLNHIYSVVSGYPAVHFSHHVHSMLEYTVTRAHTYIEYGVGGASLSIIARHLVHMHIVYLHVL